ncbi:MAG TPA: NAD-dependent dehydratase, partial [Bacteroidetes bacterium]|nr:NAD-dependent dehydratase [Bacteroidota bacterium]
MNRGTVVITGGAGFLGSHLCDYYISRDWKVIAI